jgi:hypothetical protein
MRTLLRILPIIFLMTTLFACKKDKGTFTPPYMNGTFTPPYLNVNGEQKDISKVTDSTKNREF